MEEGIFSVVIWNVLQRAHILSSNFSCGILCACPLFLVPELCSTTFHVLQTFAASPFSDPIQLDNPDPQPIIDGEEGLIWVIGPVLAVVFIICIVIAILLYKK